MFQFTRPRGARRAVLAQVHDAHAVSIHAPTWGATGGLRHLRRGCPCFNSRAHVGRDHVLVHLPAVGGVSIHAPTWGATGRARRSPAQTSSFNSRAHVGRDMKTLFPTILMILVSIHAPTWGATSAFQRTGKNGMFQFTRPRGARPGSRAAPRWPPCFNSRAHVGRDEGLGAVLRFAVVSIHAPTWGATRFLTMQSPSAPRFQFTRPRGARPAAAGICRVSCEFQFTRPRGARLGLLYVQTIR